MTEEIKKEETNETAEQEQIKPEDLFPKDIYTLLKMLLTRLASEGWIHLGLVPHPATNKIEKDLVQAKIAIDVSDFIYAQIEVKLTEDEKKALQEILGNLKLNFVEQSK